jgi:hypothetical protein
LADDTAFYGIAAIRLPPHACDFMDSLRMQENAAYRIWCLRFSLLDEQSLTTPYLISDLDED